MDQAEPLFANFHIDNIGPKAPIWPYKRPPVCNTDLEWDRYYDTQRPLWLDGYEDIPGTFIFKQQECYIKHRVLTPGRPAIERPTARWADLMIHQFIWKQMKNKRERGIIIKPRGIGLSTDFGVLPNYCMVVLPGSTTLMTSKNQTAIRPLFTEKVLVTYDHLHPRIKPVKVGGNSTKDSCSLITAEETTTEYGKGIVESSIICKETSEKPTSPNNFSGFGANLGLYDELPLHKRRSELLKSSVECYKDPITKEAKGLILGGGTVEETITGDSFTEYVQLIEDTDDEDVLFIPFWWGMFLDEAGYPDKEKAELWWNKEHDRLSKLTDTSFLIAFEKNNPRSKEDLLKLSQSGYWEQDVEEGLQVHRANVIKNPPLHRQGTIVNLQGEPIFTVTKTAPSYIEDDKTSVNPPITIIEDPVPGVEYYLLVDGVATGTESGDEQGSKVGGVIVKMLDPHGDSFSTPACYFDRPKTVESSYYNLINLAKYFDKHKGFKGIMAEGNAGTTDHFGTFLKAQGLYHWAVRRKDLSGKGNSDTDKIFQPVNDITRDYQVRWANPFLRRRMHVIKLIPLLNSLIKPANKNADLRDAWLMWFIVVKDVDAITTKVQQKRTYDTFTMVRDNQGCWVQKWVKKEY